MIKLRNSREGWRISETCERFISAQGGILGTSVGLAFATERSAFCMRGNIFRGTARKEIQSQGGSCVERILHTVLGILARRLRDCTVRTIPT